MSKEIEIIIYRGNETAQAFIYYYNERGHIVKQHKARYIVDHLYEIIEPITYEKGHYKISLKIDGKTQDIQALEKSYYEWIGGV